MKKTLALIVVLVAATLSLSAQKPLKKIDFLTNYVFLGRHAPFFVGLEKGYYRDAGFDITISPSSGTPVGAEVERVGFDDFLFDFLNDPDADPELS